MRRLKILVIGMGILLIVGIVVVIWGITRQVNRLSDAPWTRAGLGQPADAKVQDMVAAGRYVIVRVSTGGAERLLVLDPANGALIGEWHVTAPR